MYLYEYAYREGTKLVWRKVNAESEKEAIGIIRNNHKTLNSFFPYAGPLLIK